MIWYWMLLSAVMALLIYLIVDWRQVRTMDRASQMMMAAAVLIGFTVAVVLGWLILMARR